MTNVEIRKTVSSLIRHSSFGFRHSSHRSPSNGVVALFTYHHSRFTFSLNVVPFQTHRRPRFQRGLFRASALCARRHIALVARVGVSRRSPGRNRHVCLEHLFR